MIEIFSTEIKDRFNTSPAYNLRGSVGGWHQATIKFYAHWELTDVSVHFFKDNLQLEGGGSWLKAGFLPGDAITIVYSNGTTGTYNVVSVDDTFMKTDRTPDFSPATLKVSVYGTTPANAFKFSFGFPENAKADGYISRLDSKAVQEYIIQRPSFTNGTTYDLAPLYNKKFWQTPGGVTVKKIAGSSGIGWGKDNYYQIDHIFYNPAFVQDYLDADNKLDKDLSDLHADNKSPRYCFKILGATDGQNFRLSTDNSNLKSYEPKGAVAWWGYQGNGLPSLFSIGSVTYKEDVSGDIVTSLLSNAVTNVEIIINAANPSAFTSNSGQKCDVFYYEKVPKETYIDPTKDLFTNFNVSFAHLVVGGTGQTLFNKITGATLTYISATQAKVTFKIEGTGTLNDYVLWVETQSGAITDLKATDKSPIIVEEGTLKKFYNLDNVVSSNFRHIEHPFTDYADGNTDYKGWNDDGVLTIGDITVQKKNNTGQPTALDSITVQIVSENTPTDFFALETMEIPVGYSGERDFILPDGDSKLKVELTEDPSKETAYSKSYILKYAFKIRFEEWLAQNNATTPFITAKRNNKKWSNYTAFNGGLKLYVDHNINITDGSVVGQDIVRYTNDLFALDYEKYDSCAVTGQIETFDNATNDNLAGHYSTTADTRIKATFLGDGLDCYTFADTEFYGILEIYGYKNGTYVLIEQLSTVFDVKPGIKYTGLSSATKATLTKSTGPFKVTVEGILRLSKINTSASYTVTCRLGKIHPKPPETCDCRAGYTYDPVLELCVKDSDHSKTYPCWCDCPDGFEPLDGACKRTEEGTINNKNANIWYFGLNAGLNFNSLNVNGDPNQLTDGPISTDEGSSILSDSTGIYKFCTDGKYIWNASKVKVQIGGVDVVMKGGTSSTSSGIIVQDPGNANYYYIFTTQQNENSFDKFYYSRYDLGTQNIVTPVSSVITADITSNKILTVAHGYSNGALINFNTTGSLPAPLAVGTAYYVINATTDDFQVSLTSGGAAIDLTTPGSGVHSIARNLNVILSVNKVGEKICILKGPDDSTRFVIVHDNTNSNYLVYKLDATGIVLHQTFAGAFNYGTNSYAAVGYLRTNNDGLVVDVMHVTGVVLLDFNHTTGLLSNSRTLEGGDRWYGAEFSANGDVLYLGSIQGTTGLNGADHIYQYDLSSGILATIQASKTAVYTLAAPTSDATRLGALAKGPNDRIYVAVKGRSNLSVIKDPDVLGSGCNFSESTVPLTPKVVRDGLPTFDLAALSRSSITTVPCSGNSCVLPAFTIAPGCPGKAIITMTATKGRSWIVTDNQGTTPITISANGSFNFGTYSNGSVQITLTDSIRPECSSLQTIVIAC